jgi:hypothetical protein
VIDPKEGSDAPLEYRAYGPSDFEKNGQELQLDQDVRSWPAQILQEFASEHPYAYQATAPEIEFEKIDEKTGHAFGAIVLRKPYQVNGMGSGQERLEAEPEKVAVPVVIEAFLLKPFEVFIHGEKVAALTETRFAEAMGSSQVANGLDPNFQPSPLFMDKMIPPTVGYLGNLYGNYSLSGGEGDYSSMTPGKGAAETFEPKLEKASGSADPSKESTFIGTIASTIRNSEWESFKRCMSNEALCGFAVNKTLGVVREIMGTKPTSFDDYLDFVERSAPVHAVCLCRQTNGKWRCTETNDFFYKPVKRELSAAEVVARYSDVEPRIASLMRESDEILIESGNRTHVKPVVLEDHALVAERVKSDGHYMTVTKDGSFVEGQVFSRILDYTSSPYPGRLFLTGTAFAFQDEFVGERIGDVYPELKSGSVEVGDEGTFVGADEAGQFALLPFKATNVGWMGGYLVVQAVGLANEYLTFVFMPGVTRFVNATGIADSTIGSHVAGNVFYVPPSFHFMPLGKRLRLESSPAEAKDLVKRKHFFSERSLEPFAVETSRKGHGRSMRVISSGDGSFVLKGAILETLCRDREIQDQSPTDVHWLLTLLGVALEEAARITAMAVDRGEVNVSNLRPAKDIVKKDQIQDRALSELAAIFRRNLTKQASTMTDPKSVDAMLSLNFVNEANLVEFMKNIPMFRETEDKLAELYLYSSLGLKQQVPEQAALSAMKSLNEVNEHLEYLSAMMRMPASQSAPAAIA